MHKIRQILSFLERGVSQRTIEKEVKISRKTIALYLSKFQQSGVCFSDLLKQSDQQLGQPFRRILTPVKFILTALLDTLVKNLAAPE